MLASMKASVLTYCDTKCFLLLDDGWLYEGYIDEIIEVLREIDGFIDAFYIFTNRYDVLFSYSGDSRGYVLYR